MNSQFERSKRPRILCFVPYYLPGYRSGGPVRTIANWVEHFGDEFDIWIVARDRDAPDTRPYGGVELDTWNNVGKAKVFYASDAALSLPSISRLLRTTPHDLLYLNSFFSYRFTIRPLLVRRMGGVARQVPCLVAPRGEFSSGALQLKTWKKRPVILLCRLLGLYRELSWQASSEFELQDIQREFGVDAKNIHVAVDLPPSIEALEDPVESRAPGPLRIVFLSRISPKKNLDFLLRVLSTVKSAVSLSIFGPLSEPDYWGKCKELIIRLPQNVRAEYRGEVTPVEVPLAFAEHDLFVFPTRGENYGHVILESLCAGTPVLVSDQTPWPSTADNAISTICLDRSGEWVSAVERWAALDEAELYSARKASVRFAKNYLSNIAVKNDNRRLFENILAGGG